MISESQWIEQIWCACFAPRFEGEIYDYFAQVNNGAGLLLPYSTFCPSYVPDKASWLKRPFQAIGNSKVRETTVLGPAGGAKSLLGELTIAWIIDQRPGLTYYVWPTDDDAKDQMEDRIIPLIEANDFLNEKYAGLDRHKKRATKIVFPNFSLYAPGANERNAQSKRTSWLIMEEPHTYRPGLVSAFRKRCEAVPGAKIINLSTGSVKGDQTDQAYQAGSMEEWEVACPFCNEYQPMTDDLATLKYEKNDRTRGAGGEYIWPEVRRTTFYHCRACGKPWPKDTEFRELQSIGGRYRVTNPNAPEHLVSCHYGALSVPWMPVEDILEEKIKATQAFRRGGYEVLKDYVQKRKAEAWDEAPPKDQNQIAQTMGDYKLHQSWELELTRFMTGDVQKEGFWFVVRAYDLAGNSRLIDCGYVLTYADLEKKRIENKVEKIRTLLDCAHDTPIVHQNCVKHGWQALRGDDRRFFPHDDGDGNKIELPYSIPHYGHYGVAPDGKQYPAIYFLWSNPSIKDSWHHLCEIGAPLFSIASDTPDAYKSHSTSEYTRLAYNRHGEPVWSWYVPEGTANHLLDCEQMNYVAAAMDPRLPIGKRLLEESKNPTEGHK